LGKLASSWRDDPTHVTGRRREARSIYTNIRILLYAVKRWLGRPGNGERSPLVRVVVPHPRYGMFRPRRQEPMRTPPGTSRIAFESPLGPKRGEPSVTTMPFVRPDWKRMDRDENRHFANRQKYARNYGKYFSWQVPTGRGERYKCRQTLRTHFTRSRIL